MLNHCSKRTNVRNTVALRVVLVSGMNLARAVNSAALDACHQRRYLHDSVIHCRWHWRVLAMRTGSAESATRWVPF